MTGWILLAAAAAAAAALGRSAYERDQLVTTTYTIQSAKISPEFDGTRLVYLADLHNREFGQENCRLIETIRAARPQIILGGGDMMIAKGQKNCSLETTLKLFSQLAKEYPVYYGMGNHELRLKSLEVYRDRYRQFLCELRRSGVRVLDDMSVSLHGSQGSLTISGLTVPAEAYPKGRKIPLEKGLISRKIGKVPEGDMRILLAHTPLYQEEYAQWGADVTLSGHYHGGTIILPLLGGVMSPDYHLFPRIYRGRYECQGKTLIVSGGLGTHSVNIRLGNKPEIVVLELRRGA